MEVKLGPAEVGEGEFRSFELAPERHVLVTRLGGALYAIDDLCNHAGCLLSGGWLDGASVVCPCHEYQFDVRTGENTTSVRLCDDQARYPLRVVDGELVVELPEREAGK
jgi:3-phenylpropionate/trans-cinnamate dioxygenase ferredoxin subunit